MTDLWRGHKVRLRAVDVSDFDAFHADSHDMAVQRLGNETNLPLSAKLLRERLEKPAPHDTQNCWLAVESLEHGCLVGSVSVHDANRRHRNFKYGVAIFREYWRRGFAIEAISLLLRYYFRELGYRRVTAVVYSFNTASLALHEQMGFVREGVLRQSLFTQGRFFDEVVFGLLASEFEALESALPEEASLD
ncbi:MAG: GNAT family protein [Pseudomonadota bacterium]